MKLNAATRLLADWWSDLGPDGQDKYIKNHPNSEKAKEARKGGGGGNGAPKGPEKKDKKEDKKPSGNGGGKEPPKNTAPKQSEEEEPKKNEKPSKEPGDDSKAEQKQPPKENKVAPKNAPQSPVGDEKPKQKPLAPGKPLSDYAKSKDDPNVTVDQIYATLSESDAAEMKERADEANRLARDEGSDKMYTDANGQYTPERKALHDQIMKSILTADAIKRATPAPGEKPTFVVLGGRGGSGKSAFTSEEGKPAKVKEFDSDKFVVLDPDAVKQALKPPYKGWNAAQVHEESSYIFDNILAQARSMGVNIVSDATLKSDKMGSVLEGLIGQGYDVEGHYMFLPRQLAAQRACGRYLQQGPESRGRLVPPDVILGNTNNEANFDKLKKYFKRFSAYDNDQPKGQPPKLIDHSDFASKKEEARIRKVMSMEKKTEAKINPKGDGYNPDLWENDAFLGMTPERMARAQKDLFPNMRATGIRTGQIRDPKTRAEYTEYLKKVGG